MLLPLSACPRLLTKVVVVCACAEAGRRSAPTSERHAAAASARARPRGAPARRAGTRRPCGGGCGLRRGMAAPRGRQAVRRAVVLLRPRRSHGARRSALGARRSALGARRSALGARTIIPYRSVMRTIKNNTVRCRKKCTPKTGLKTLVSLSPTLSSLILVPLFRYASEAPHEPGIVGSNDAPDGSAGRPAVRHYKRLQTVSLITG